MKVRLARRFSWLRWMLTTDELIAEIKAHNQRERDDVEFRG